LNVVPFDGFVTHHTRFLVYGDFVRLSFLNWILPELRERGVHLEVLDRAGDNMLLMASGESSGDGEHSDGRDASRSIPVR